MNKDEIMKLVGITELNKAIYPRPSAVEPDPISSILGMSVFVMKNQKAGAWIISDERIASDYRQGYISEDTLKRISDKAIEVRATQDKASIPIS